MGWSFHTQNSTPKVQVAIVAQALLILVQSRQEVGGVQGYCRGQTQDYEAACPGEVAEGIWQR